MCDFLWLDMLPELRSVTRGFLWPLARDRLRRTNKAMYVEDAGYPPKLPAVLTEYYQRAKRNDDTVKCSSIQVYMSQWIEIAPTLSWLGALNTHASGPFNGIERLEPSALSLSVLTSVQGCYSGSSFNNRNRGYSIHFVARCPSANCKHEAELDCYMNVDGCEPLWSLYIWICAWCHHIGPYSSHVADKTRYVSLNEFMSVHLHALLAFINHHPVASVINTQ